MLFYSDEATKLNPAEKAALWRAHVAGLVKAAKGVKLTVDGLLMLCKVCSNCANAKETFLKDLTKEEARAAKRLIEQDVLTADYHGRLFPTELGFVAVGNLAPIPQYLRDAVDAPPVKAPPMPRPTW